MSTDEKLLLRNKILGVLIRDARNASGKTQDECAEFLGTSSGRVSDIEHGERPISLPELEALAFFLEVPLEHFWDDQLLEPGDVRQQLSTDDLFALRNRVVGVLLRQARLAANKTQEECGQFIGVSGSKISSYEYGNTPIPLAELEALAEYLEVPLDTFMDKANNPIIKIAHQSDALEKLGHLSPEIQDFLMEPLNVDYLQTALSLSKMPAGQLRSIAETLLEITY